MEARIVSSFVAYDVDGEEAEMYEGDNLMIHSHNDDGFTFSVIGDDDVSPDEVYNYNGACVEHLCDWKLNEDKNSEEIQEEYIKPKIDVRNINIVDDAELLI